MARKRDRSPQGTGTKKALEGVYVMLKFFRNEEHLDALIAGKIHCRTAEYYRGTEAKGVGDPYESCAMSWRQGRDPPDLELRINGRRIQGVLAFTMHNGTMPDNWMHCWTVFRMPEHGHALDQLTEDLQRMRREFGEHYAVLTSNGINEAYRRINAAAPKGARLIEVLYSDDPMQWSPACKRKAFEYQREARFLFGKCPAKADRTLEFNVPGGLQDLITKNADLRMVHRTGGESILAMSAAGVTSSRAQG